MDLDFFPGKAFVSISAVTSLDELGDIVKIKDELDLNFPLVIGWQLSSNSINNGTRNSRQPKFSEIKELYRASLENGLISAFHYYTKDMNSMEDDLEILANKLNFSDSIKLLQFNTLPPSRENLEITRALGFSPIFKVPIADKKLAPVGYRNDRVRDIKNAGANDIYSEVQDVGDLINYAMFDPSHGVGIPLDQDLGGLGHLVGELVYRDLNLNCVGLVYAGNIGPENVGQTFRNFDNHFPGRVSLDSESALRTDDRLDMTKVRGYLTEANLAWNS